MQARREEPGEGEPAEPPSPRVPKGSKAEQWWGQKGVSQFIPSTLAPGVQSRLDPALPGYCQSPRGGALP